MHAIAQNFPLDPTDLDRRRYAAFFRSLKYVLPCGACRRSYSRFIARGDTKLRASSFVDRRAVCEWVFRVHNAVNLKLDRPPKRRLDSVLKFYERFRGKCSSDGCNASRGPGYRKYRSRVVIERRRAIT